MGLRFRMKSSYDISGISGQAHVIAVAMKNYGMFVADNGSTGTFKAKAGVNRRAGTTTTSISSRMFPTPRLRW